MLYKKEIEKVLECPCIDLVNLVMQMVNLKDKERTAIELVYIRGMTQEEASVKMNCSNKTIGNYKKKAFDKMGKAWANNDIINKILEEE